MFLIFSGFNQRAVIAFLRALEKNRVCNYKIVASGKDDPILMTKYLDMVFFVREHRQLYKPEMYTIMRTAVEESGNDKVVIVPSTEGLNRFLIENREEIEALGITIPLVDCSLYSKISDKRSFWELCKENGFKVPKNIKISDNYECRYVAKPVKYVSKNGERLIPIIVDNEEKHLAFLKNYDITDFDIQEFVDGESIYLLYYLAKTGENYSFSQRNLVQQPNGKSMVVAISWNTHKDKISDEYIRFLRSIGFYGFIMIEIRKKGIDYYMIEANPRMWGPSQLYVDAGVPFIEAFLFDYKEIKSIPQRMINEKTTYYWSTGIKEALLEDKDCVWLDGGLQLVKDNLDLVYSSDIYKRPDTIRIYEEERNYWKGKY